MGTAQTSNGQTTLNRWLNVNSPSRNKRVRGYLACATDQVAALSPVALWNGTYSVKVCQINVVTDHNYSIVQTFHGIEGLIGGLDTQLLWTIAIMDSSRDTAQSFGLRRYRLNNAVGYTIDLEGDYNGEVVGPYTTFEAWTVPLSNLRFAKSDAPQQILTSILSPNLDIRNGGNFQMSLQSTGYEAFNNTSVSIVGLFNLPMTFPPYVAAYNI